MEQRLASTVFIIPSAAIQEQLTSRMLPNFSKESGLPSIREQGFPSGMSIISLWFKSSWGSLRVYLRDWGIVSILGRDISQQSVQWGRAHQLIYIPLVDEEFKGGSGGRMQATLEATHSCSSRAELVYYSHGVVFYLFLILSVILLCIRCIVHHCPLSLVSRVLLSKQTDAPADCHSRILAARPPGIPRTLAPGNTCRRWLHWMHACCPVPWHICHSLLRCRYRGNRQTNSCWCCTRQEYRDHDHHRTLIVVAFNEFVIRAGQLIYPLHCCLVFGETGTPEI